MGKTVVVCDEIQLIGDKTRGQNVEILLTMISNAGWDICLDNGGHFSYLYNLELELV